MVELRGIAASPGIAIGTVLLYREDAPCYPPYMQGAGYVLSRDLVQLLVRRARALPYLPAVEDALVGTLLEV